MLGWVTPLVRMSRASDNDRCHRSHLPQAISSMMSHRPQEAHREPLPLDHKDPGTRRERVHIIETSAQRVEKSPKFRHVPPRGVRSFWIAWARGRSSCTSDHGVDPLVVMALAHYQFEAIHPDRKMLDSVVVASLKDHQVVSVDEIHEPMLLCDAPRPRPGCPIPELFWFPDPAEGVAETGVDESVDPLENPAVRGLPVRVIFPGRGIPRQARLSPPG